MTKRKIITITIFLTAQKNASYTSFLMIEKMIIGSENKQL